MNVYFNCLPFEVLTFLLFITLELWKMDGFLFFFFPSLRIWNVQHCMLVLLSLSVIGYFVVSSTMQLHKKCILTIQKNAYCWTCDLLFCNSTLRFVLIHKISPLKFNKLVPHYREKKWQGELKKAQLFPYFSGIP